MSTRPVTPPPTPLDGAQLAARGLSVVVPAFNEEESIHRVARAVHEAGQELVRLGEIDEYELIVVDDASTDDTPGICDRLADEDPRFTVIHHPNQRTLGGSLRTGLSAARGHFVLYTDADLPFDLGEVPKALRLMRHYDADVVSAYRLSRTGEGLLRLAYSHVYNTLVRLRFGLRIRDVNFAAKLMRADVLEHVELRSEGSFIDAELLIRIERSGFSTIQFGVDYFPRSRGTSTLSSWAVIWQLLCEMRSIGPELSNRPARSPSPARRP